MRGADQAGRVWGSCWALREGQWGDRQLCLHAGRILKFVTNKELKKYMAERTTIMHDWATFGADLVNQISFGNSIRGPAPLALYSFQQEKKGGKGKEGQ